MKGVENWLKSVSAFANGTGGVLVFGTAADGTVAGLKDMETASEVIRAKIEEYIVPMPGVELRVQEAESGKRLLLLEVAAGQETPYYYIGEDAAAVYVRSAKASVPAGAQELKRLILKGRYIAYDTQISRYNTGDYTFADFSVAYQEWTGNTMDDRKFEDFRMAKGGKLTTAGLLFADASPVMHSRVSCRRWTGNREDKDRQLLKSEEYSGGLIYLLNKGIWFIKSNMKVVWKEEEGKKREFADYRDESIFEALLNAFVHRDYFITGGEMRIDMYENCLTVCSPGGMPDGTNIQDKKQDMILPVRRNAVLADIFYQIGYMRQQGTGVRRIKASCEEAVNYRPEKAPEFYSDAGQFTTVLKNLNYKEKLEKRTEEAVYEEYRQKEGDSGDNANNGIGGNDGGILLNENEKKVLAILLEQPTVSTDSISQRSKIAKRTVERILQALKRKGAVVREGSRRSGRWKVLLREI